MKCTYFSCFITTDENVKACELWLLGIDFCLFQFFFPYRMSSCKWWMCLNAGYLVFIEIRGRLSLCTNSVVFSSIARCHVPCVINMAKLLTKFGSTCIRYERAPQKIVLKMRVQKKSAWPQFMIKKKKSIACAAGCFFLISVKIVYVLKCITNDET